MPINLAVIYYSATGTNHQLAQWAAEGGKEAGAEVKVLKVAELAAEDAIASNPAWKAHVEATKNVPVVTHDDIEWRMHHFQHTYTLWKYGGSNEKISWTLQEASGFMAKPSTK